MNTDKLMDLVEKVRDAELFEDGVSADLFIAGVHTIAAAYMRGRQDSCDELAAALRAEQAVGDEQRAREMLAEEYERGGRDGPYPTYAMVARAGKGAFTLCSIRAIQRGIEYGRALGTARQSEGVVLEGVFAPRYVADGPEGMFGTDDLELAGKLIARGADDPDDWTVTDLTETGIEATKEAAAPGGEGEG